MEEGDSELFLVALQNVAKASGKEVEWFERLKIVQPSSADGIYQLFFLLKELRLGLKPMEFPKAS